MEVEKILLIELNGIGDLLMATPLLRTLRENLPKAIISVMVVANRGTDEIIKYNPCVDEIIIYDPQTYKGLFGKARLVREIRRKGFQSAMVLYPSYGSAFPFLAWLSKIPIRIGHITQCANFKFSWENFYNQPLKIKNEWHHIDFNLELAPLLLGKKVRYPSYPELYLSEEEERWSRDFLKRHSIKPGDKLCGFHPGSHQDFKLKRWPKDRFVVLARRLARVDGYKVLLFGSKEEGDLLQEISNKAMTSPIIVQDLNMLKVAALIAKCHVFIANDSGLMHMASALKVPLVALIGPSNPLKIGPRVKNKMVILTTKNDLMCRRFVGYNAACVSLFQKKCLRMSNGIPACFGDVSVERVIEAIKKIGLSGEAL